MKKMITLGLALFVFCSVQAQQFSGGLRTGASYWIDKDNSNCSFKGGKGDNLTWDKEVFFRYNTKGKLVFEASMGHYVHDWSYQREDMFLPAVAGENYYVANEKSQNIEWNLSAQYDVSCAALQSKCPMLKNLRSYIGVVLTPTLSRTTTRLNYVENSSVYSGKSSTRDEMTLWTGLTHTMVYNLCERMYITSAVRLQIDPNSFFEDAGALKARDARMGLQIGVGYNLQ